MLIDSGAPINTIAEASWQKIERDIEREQAIIYDINFNCKRVVRAYAKNTPLEVIATFKAWIEIIECEKPKVFAEFFVVRGASQSLLGKFTAIEMKVLKLGIQVNVLQARSNGGSEIKKEDELAKVPNFRLKFDIDENITPKRRPYYRVPAALETSVNDRLGKMERQGIIEIAPETSKWIAPMEVVMKAKTDYRLVVDMQEPNKAIQRAHYPLPNMDKFRIALRGSKVFAKLDIKSAFHHVELHPDSRPITTFMTSRGPMRFKRLPFGVNTGPEVFQRLMEGILRKCRGCIIYIDDILVYAQGIKELRERVEEVKATLRSNNLTLNEEKCQYDRNETEFLGYKISQEGLRPADDKVQAVNDFRRPKSASELRSFLGLVTYISQFIKDFSTKTEPLRQLMKKASKWEWGQHQEAAFELLKHEVKENIEAQGFFKSGAPTKLFTDASKVGLGAVLVQEQEDGHDQVVAYASKSLTETEQRYAQTEREAMAVMWAVEKFHYYLLGSFFTVFTDHQALEYLYKGKYRDGKRAITRAEGWALRLEAYNFDIKYIKGSSNIADLLSRLCKDGDKPFKERDNKVELGSIKLDISALEDQMRVISIADVREATSTDEEMQQIMQAIELQEWPEGIKAYRPFEKEMRAAEGILLRGERIVLPKILRQQALKVTHAGHPGVVTMKRALRERVWWSGMDADVDNHAKNCLSCTVIAKENPPEPMTRTELPKQPWEYVAIDFYGAAEIKEKILVLTDYYSRYICAEPITTNDTTHTTAALQKIFDDKGYPKMLKMDNGPPFQGDDMAEWFKNRDINTMHSIPLWPQQNGQVERTMQGLTRALAAGKLEKKRYRETLKEYVIACNNRPHAVTGKVPNELMFNRSFRGPLPLWKDHSYRFDDDMRDKDRISKFKGKEYADRKRRASPSEIEVGDEVMIHSKETGKLKPNFDPTPYEVTERIGSSIKMKGSDGRIVHRNVAQIKKRPQINDSNFSNGEDKGSEEVIGGKIIENDAEQSERPKRQIKPAKRFGFT